MSEQPILFLGPMVRAILDGRQTQTRRVAKFIEPCDAGWHIHNAGGGIFGASDEVVRQSGPDYARYSEGDRLWVREAWAKVGDADDDIHACPDLRVHAYYRADAVDPERQKWRPSIHMPRWASRITLEVTGVKVERLQDISEADARAEGAGPVHMQPNGQAGNPSDGWISYVEGFRGVWTSINGSGSWDANPWVVAISFTREAGHV